MKLARGATAAETPAPVPAMVPASGPSAVDAARAVLETATAAQAAGDVAVAAARQQVDEIAAKAAGLDDTITPRHLQDADGELNFALCRLPALAAATAAAQVVLGVAQADVVLAEFVAWYGGAEASILAKAQDIQAEFAGFVEQIGDYNQTLHGFRQILDHTPQYAGSRLAMDPAGRLRLDGIPVEYSSGPEWICRLAGQALTNLPNEEGRRLGGQLAETGRVVHPVPPAERPDLGIQWNAVRPALPTWLAQAIAPDANRVVIR